MPNKMSAKKKQDFLSAQLMTLIVLESVQRGSSAELGEAATEALDNALAITTASLDRFVGDYPKLASKVDQTIKSFGFPNGEV